MYIRPLGIVYTTSGIVTQVIELLFIVSQSFVLSELPFGWFLLLCLQVHLSLLLCLLNSSSELYILDFSFVLFLCVFYLFPCDVMLCSPGSASAISCSSCRLLVALLEDHSPALPVVSSLQTIVA